MLGCLDGGKDSLDNVDVWYEYALEKVYCEQPREGKRVWTFSFQHERSPKGYDCSNRRVMQVVERTIDKRGQSLLVPEIAIAE